jgi:hypothetical protein
VLQGISDQERKALILTVGNHRRDRVLNPVEVARIFQKLLDNGASLADCAALVHLDGTSMVSRFLRLLDLGEDGEIAVDFGPSRSTIGFSSAFEISRLSSPDRHIAIRAAIENRMGKEEVKGLVQYRLRSGKPMDECIAQTLKMRPQIERQYMYIGRLDDDMVIQRLRSMTQAERDRALKQALKDIDPRLESSSGRMSAVRFSIVGDAAASKIIGTLQPNFEQAISSQLKRTLGPQL